VLVGLFALETMGLKQETFSHCWNSVGIKKDHRVYYMEVPIDPHNLLYECSHTSLELRVDDMKKRKGVWVFVWVKRTSFKDEWPLFWISAFRGIRFFQLGNSTNQGFRECGFDQSDFCTLIVQPINNLGSHTFNQWALFMLKSQWMTEFQYRTFNWSNSFALRV
jgi:hypothetical protein